MRNGVAVLLLASLLAGCGKGKPTPQGDQAQISGSVSLDGKPIPVDSSVIFYCKEKAATAAGKVDSLGNYSLTGGDPAKGIPVGRYVVTVRPPEAAPVTTDSSDYNARMMSGGAAAKPKAAATGGIPTAFLTMDTSPIVVEVKAGPNTFELPLDKLVKK